MPVVPISPAIWRTQEVLLQRFWWPTLKEDTRDFVQSCLVCNQHKPSHHAPAGLLQPLPIPHQPRSNVSLDFVTGLLPSDRHSWTHPHGGGPVLPLNKLPSAKETAQLVLRHFCLHGLPVDVVSNRGPQFSSVFWKEFCTLIGETTSLSSGFNPQSNRQTERKNQEKENCTSLHGLPKPVFMVQAICGIRP